MRKLFTLLAVLFVVVFNTQITESQISYIRTGFTGTYTAITVGGGATSIVGGVGTNNFSTSAGVSSVDDGTAYIPLPFDFTFAGTTYTNTTNFVGICTNGYLYFSTVNTNASKITSAANANLYTTTTPNATIAAWWDDMSMGTGSCLYQTQGVVGSRTFTIQWTSWNSYYLTSTRKIDFQIILYEGTNVIELRYGGITAGIPSTSESASIGIENATGGNGNYIDAVTGSKNTNNQMMTSNKWQQVYFYRFEPGTPTAITGGTYNVGVAQTYKTLSEAIADVNHKGISGPITLNLSDALYDTTAAGGNNIYPMILGPVSGNSSSNTIEISAVVSATLRTNGTSSGSIGNQTTTSALGTTAEPVLGLCGADYTTIKNLVLTTSNSTGANTYLLDAGVRLFNSSATDGANNNNILNNTVRISCINTSSRAFCSSLPTTPTAASGSNSNNKFNNNVIDSAYYGFELNGFLDVAPFALYDQNNEIGVTTGNLIKAFGGAATTAYGINAIYQNGIKVANNSVIGGSHGTLLHSTTLTGIFLSTGSNSNVDIYNNTITLTSNATTSTMAGISSSMGGLSTVVSNTVNIYNNTITGCTYNTATSGAFDGITVGAGPNTLNIYNNNVHTNTVGTAVGTGQFTGLRQTTVTTLTAYTSNYYNNNVYNNTQNGTGAIQSIRLFGTGTGTINAYQNNLYNNVNNGGQVNGIFFGSVFNANVYRNNIYGLYSNTGTAGTSFGINYAATAAGTVTIYNNYISDLRAPASTSTLAVVGIYGSTSTASTNLNAFYNTVYLNASSTSATTFGTAACYMNTVPNADLRNNIFVNNSTPGPTGGNTTAYQRSSTTLTTYASASNNNCLYVPGGANRYIYSDATNNYTNAQIGSYKGLVSPRDASAFVENPTFINVASTPYDLHINTSVATQCESGGITVSSPLSITNDYDNNARYPNAGYPIGGSTPTAPDVGADEFGGISLDLSGPTISYTALSNTTVVATRSFTNVTITDGSGVNTSAGTMPRCYFKRTTDMNTYAGNTAGDDGWKWVEANGTSSPFDFTLDFSLILGGSINTGDVIQYFVTAQDLVATPNVGINQGSFASTPASVGDYANMFPLSGTIRTFLVVDAPMSGTYTVGLSMMKPLTGKNLEFAAKTRKVKKLVPAENTDSKENITTEKKEDYKELNQSGVINSFKDLTKTEMIEIEVEETYYELQESGKVYKGSQYVEYPQKTGDNKSQGQSTPELVGNYTTITAALTDLNNRGLNGAVTFLLIDNGTYAGETYPLQLNSNISGISSTNTVTIKPQSGVSSIIPGSIASNATFRILSNYVTIDGSNSGGTDRSLTIQNNNTTAPNVVLIGSTGTTPITNVTLKNCTITDGANTSSAVVISDATSIGSAGYFNTVTIQNNLIEKAYIGVYATGGSASVNGYNLTVSDNTLTSSGANSIRLVGLYAQYTNGATFSNNTVGNIANTTDANFTGGIWGASGCSNVTISGNTIGPISSTTSTSSFYLFGILLSSGVATSNSNISTNTINNISCTNSATALGIGFYGATDGVTIERNYVTNIKNSNTTGWGAAGIWVGGTTTTGTNVIKNNMISDVAAYGYASGTSLTDNGYGIIINGGAGHKLYNNSVNMNTNQTLATGLPAAVNITSGVTTPNGLDIRNNVFNNSMTSGTQRYAIYSGAANTVYSSIDYNCYYSPTNLGNLGATDRTTMANWRTATGKDVLSFNATPVFTSATDLHINASNLTVSGRGTYIASVTNDYDGNGRATSQSTSSRPVDVGCDQYTPSGYTGNITTLSGSIYYDGNLRAVEVVSGSISVTDVRQFPGVQTPNNTLFKKTNGIETPVKNSKKQGEKGGESGRSAVTTPWIYWEVNGLSTTGATVRFYYNDEQLATISEANLRISYWDGSAWDNTLSQSINQTSNYIQLDLPGGFTWAGNSLFAMEDSSFPLPVVLSEFNVSARSNDAILKWVTTAELNNKGFAIERRTRLDAGESQYSAWKEVSFVNGSGTTNEPKTYTYTDKKLNVAVYQYRLRQVDYNGHTEYFNPAQTDIAIGKPGVFELGQNYPNPSNPKSKIDFQMPFDGKISIKVYDILGQEVKTLVDEFKSADYYTVEFDGSNLASGTYFYRVIAEGNGQKFTKTLKMILVK